MEFIFQIESEHRWKKANKHESNCYSNYYITEQGKDHFIYGWVLGKRHLGVRTIFSLRNKSDSVENRMKANLVWEGSTDHRDGIKYQGILKGPG